MLVLADFLLPSTTKDVGPSTTGLFHGGEGARDERPDLVREPNLRFLPASTSPSVSSSALMAATATSGAELPFVWVPLTNEVGLKVVWSNAGSGDDGAVLSTCKGTCTTSPSDIAKTRCFCPGTQTCHSKPRDISMSVVSIDSRGCAWSGTVFRSRTARLVGKILWKW